MDNKSIAIAGSGTLFIGVFVPVVSLPLVGNMNFFANGKGDGVLLIALALIALGLALSGKTRYVLWPGLLSLAFLGYKFVGFRSMISEMESKMDTELAGNPFRGLAEAAMSSVQMQWGWAVLLVGAGFLTYAGWMERRNS